MSDGMMEALRIGAATALVPVIGWCVENGNAAIRRLPEGRFKRFLLFEWK